MRKKEYVAGFMFHYLDLFIVALIEKQKPAWQKGKLNGIGGKIEINETPVDAMVREFKEEAGVDTAASQWTHYATLESGDSIVYFFAGKGDLESVYSAEVEEVKLIRVENLSFLPVIPNLTWLVPMAQLAVKNDHNYVYIKEGN